MWYTEPVGKGRRLGWLLRVNRLYTTQSRYNRLRNFATEFSRDGSCAATVGTFSRWETGASTVPYRAVRRYERMLNLPDYSLVSVIDTISRYMSPTTGPAPLLERPEKPDEPGVILSPNKVWAELSERLLHETSVADGTLWMHRAEAFNRLIAHPAGQDAAISTADRRFYGALLASVRKLRNGHFTAAQLRKLVPVLLAEGRNNARLAAVVRHAIPAAAGPRTRPGTGRGTAPRQHAARGDAARSTPHPRRPRRTSTRRTAAPGAEHARPLVDHPAVAHPRQRPPVTPAATAQVSHSAPARLARPVVRAA